MTTTTTTNPHQPTTEAKQITCTAPDCGYSMHRHPNPDGSSMDKFLLELFRKNHAAQYDAGRAPDIEVDWVISADCSVCPDGGELYVVDGEAIQCSECNTAWNMDGTHGELDDWEDSEEDKPRTWGAGVIVEPTATPDPTWETAGELHDYRLTCNRCAYGAGGVKQAMTHLEEHPDHTMTGVIDSEGTTVRVSASEADE